ncbi:hypothetical protein [Streptomyces sp. NPDC017993]|uniref:hypothetical protein n=1 Tax=Streptomyces sp. NPDC017993 TaxID=3365027 RepID=UPI0037AB8F8B
MSKQKALGEDRDGALTECAHCDGFVCLNCGVERVHDVLGWCDACEGPQPDEASYEPVTPQGDETYDGPFPQGRLTSVVARIVAATGRSYSSVNWAINQQSGVRSRVGAGEHVIRRATWVAEYWLQQLDTSSATPLKQSRPVGADSWATNDWVVWEITVYDPEYRISEPYNTAGVGFLLAKESREVMVGFADVLGCVYEGCKDDGTVGSDDDPCYSWWFRVPQAEHAQRNAQRWPVVVEELRRKLDRMFADQHHWGVLVDGRRTRALVTGEQMAPLL